MGLKKLQTILSKDLTRMKVTIEFVHSDSIVRGWRWTFSEMGYYELVDWLEETFK